jgi:hypothetical protein
MYTGFLDTFLEKRFVFVTVENFKNAMAQQG